MCCLVLCLFASLHDVRGVLTPMSVPASLTKISLSFCVSASLSHLMLQFFCHCTYLLVSVTVSAQDGIVRLTRAPPPLPPPPSPQGCTENSANICLVEHRSFSTLEGGMSAASFLDSSFLQAINAVMLWLCSESSSSLGAPLPCQAADQM